MGTWHGHIPRGELVCGCITKINHREHEGTPHWDQHQAQLFPPSPKTSLLGEKTPGSLPRPQQSSARGCGLAKLPLSYVQVPWTIGRVGFVAWAALVQGHGFGSSSPVLSYRRGADGLLAAGAV